MKSPALQMGLLSILSIGLPVHPPAGAPPFAPTTTHTTYTNLPYGPDAQQTFDLLVPDNFPAGKSKHPLVVYIHGGGFDSGDKSAASGFSTQINQFLQQGIAFAAINYRLLDDPDPDGILRKCLADCKRFMQFIRLNAATYEVEKTRIAIWGHSAGAGSGLWLAFHKDFKDPSGTPLEQQSTKPLTVVAQQTQSTYDIDVWPAIFTNVPAVGGGTTSLTLPQIISIAGMVKVKSMYGVTGPLNWTALQADRDELNLLKLMDANDPPFWVEHANIKEALPATVTKKILYHHPYHSDTLLTRAQSLIAGYAGTPKLAVYARIPKLGKSVLPGYANTPVQFLIHALTQ